MVVPLALAGGSAWRSVCTPWGWIRSLSGPGWWSAEYVHLPKSEFCPEDFFLSFFFLLCRATLVAYGGSQARGQIRAVAAGLRHSHSNAGSKPRLRPTPQLTATPDL